MGVAPGRVLAVLISAAALAGFAQGAGARATDVPSCGNGLGLPPWHVPPPADCLRQAYRAGTRAQGAVLGYTIAGAPVVYRVRVFANFVRVHVDPRDGSADRRGVDYLCAGLARSPMEPARDAIEAVECAGPPDFLDGSEIRALLIP